MLSGIYTRINVLGGLPIAADDQRIREEHLLAARAKSGHDDFAELCIRRKRNAHVSPRGIETRKQREERNRQEKARLEERRRIARELHDTLLQTVSGTSFQLWAIVNALPPDSQVKSKLDRIVQLMERGLEEGRNAIQGLRSADSQPSDLDAA
jgi:signal transduction histidine kinase